MGCCDPKAPRLISIRVGDGQVGLRGLDIIVEAVRGLDLQKEEEIKQELLSRVKLLQLYYRLCQREICGGFVVNVILGKE